MWCRECGKDLGRGWQEAPLCPDCQTNKSERCSCDTSWDENCKVHMLCDPHDIPF
jgi:hypothetical protein